MPCEMTTFREILSDVTRKRPLESEGDLAATPLRRTLTTFQLVFIGMGCMIAAGLFVLTGVVAKTVTGPAVTVSYTIAAVASLISAFCYVEVACRVPRTGSAYIFTYIAIGEVWAFAIGWDLLFEYLLGVSATIRSLSGYLDALLDNAISNFTVNEILGGETWGNPHFAPYPDFLGSFLTILLGLFTLTGVVASSRMNVVILTVDLIVIAVILVTGFLHANIDNWTDFGGFFPNGPGSVISGAATLFFSYVGFDAIAIAVEETLDPRKSIPIAMFISISLTALIYVVAGAVLTLLLPWVELDDQSPFVDAFTHHGVYWVKWLVSIGAICAMLNSSLVMFYCLPRSIYAMSRDGLLFESLGVINTVTKVPVLATIFSMILVVLLTLFFDQVQLVEFLSIGVLNGYIFVACALIILRYRPEQELNDCTNSKTGLELKSPAASSGIIDGAETADPLGTGNARSATAENANLLDPMATVPPTIGTLKPFFRTLPLLRSLAQFAPGQAVAASLAVSIVFQILAISLVEHGTAHIRAMEWWALILLCCFILCALGAFLVILLHFQNSAPADYYKVPWVPVFPAASIFVNIVLVLKLRLVTWIRFLISITLGLLVYISYGYRHSKVGQARRNSDRNRRPSVEDVLLRKGINSYGSSSGAQVIEEN